MVSDGGDQSGNFRQAARSGGGYSGRASREIGVAGESIKQCRARLRRALAHIHANLDGDLSVAALCRVAAFSKHHFHRRFTALFGIGVHRYVRLVRLKRASYRLAFRDDAVIQIALDSGYEGPEAFSRAFKQEVGQPPSLFRRQPRWEAWRATFQPIGEIAMIHADQDFHEGRVGIAVVPDTRVAVLEHRGDPALIGESVRRFIAWRKSMKLPPRISATYTILYDNPDTTPPEAFRLDLCAATDLAVEPNDAGIVGKLIPGGRCAVLRHVGSDETLGEAASYLFTGWLPHSGETLRDFPLYCQRVTFFPDVPEHEAVTDLFLPIR